VAISNVQLFIASVFILKRNRNAKSCEGYCQAPAVNWCNSKSQYTGRQ